MTTTAINPADHRRLAGKFALPYLRWYPHRDEDILAAAYVGLVLAARKYDGRGRFSTYAAEWVKREILAEIRDFDAIRLPRSCDVRSEDQVAAVERTKAAAIYGSDYGLDRIAAPSPAPRKKTPVRVELVGKARIGIVASCRCGAEFRSLFARPWNFEANASVAVRFRARAASEGWIAAGANAATCPDCRPPGRLVSPRLPPGLTPMGRDDVAAVRRLFDLGYSAEEVAGWFGIPKQLATAINLKGQAAARDAS